MDSLLNGINALTGSGLLGDGGDSNSFFDTYELASFLLNRAKIGLSDAAGVIAKWTGADDKAVSAFVAIVYGAGNGSVDSLLNGINALTGSGLLSDGGDSNSFFDSYELANFLLNSVKLGLGETAKTINKWLATPDRAVTFWSIVSGAGREEADGIRGLIGAQLLDNDFWKISDFLNSQFSLSKTRSILKSLGFKV